MSDVKLSIVIPVYNNSNFTKSCLNDLESLPLDHEIVVVDNGSTDDTPQVLTELINRRENVVYVAYAQNRGFAIACNAGFAKSTGKFVMFLNNDIRVKDNKAGWTNAILEQSKDAIVGPTGGLLDSALNFVRETNSLIDSKYFYMSGWNLTAARDTWNRLTLSNHDGPFSSEMGIAFFEDTDLSFRARELGIPFRIVSVPVVHFGHMTAKKLNISMLYRQAHSKFKDKWATRLKK